MGRGEEQGGRGWSISYYTVGQEKHQNSVLFKHVKNGDLMM
jgi:hypothetical protein